MRVLNPRFAAAALAATLLPSLAGAQLGFTARGPLDPNNGFPTNYTDTNGVSLDLCTTDPIMCGLVAPVTLTNPGAAFPANYGGTFPEELFYNRVVAKMNTNGASLATLVIALEGAFFNGPVVAGDQMVFSRVRIRAAGLVAGQTYTVTTPVGTFTFVANSNNSINNTDQIGGVIGGDFNTALIGHSGPFLQWDTDQAALTVGGRDYLGNPALDHTITGSPAGTNFFRIDGPSVGGPGVNRVETNVFQVIGLKTQAAPPPPPPVAPVAAFNAAPLSGNSPLNVAFTDASTGTITSWAWSFGDGSVSSLQNPSHVYIAGTYSVSLTVTGPGGSNTLSKPNLIVVGNTPPPPPPAQLTIANPVPGVAGVANTITITGCQPNSKVGVISGLVLGAGLFRNSQCAAGIPVGLGQPFRTLGTARANAAGVATLVTTPPRTSAGRIFHFQAVEPATCSASNVVSQQL